MQYMSSLSNSLRPYTQLVDKSECAVFNAGESLSVNMHLFKVCHFGQPVCSCPDVLVSKDTTWMH